MESVTASESAPKPKKITVKLKNIGDAPVLKNKKLVVKASDTLASLTKVLRKMLNLTLHDSLFLYIDTTFAPSLDSTFEVLARCYAVKTTGDEVVELQYSTTPAYG
ncbi:hypothetical protein B9Z55_009415 [Caenorhabditis nigoni]|uniref:Ubiquitin-like protein ATG12 n=1 Tax=Caenorhabditis nigoni TaxID=1611254 RepID=A0A2G5USD1_9PELO|nr:hypothetical protein B9Z55_009415 [Caenorhabditis nigoni]